MAEELRTRYIIQVEGPGKDPDLSQVKQLMQGMGVEFDSAYGPYPVNPKLGRYVMRGWATARAKEKAEQIPGVRFFADTKIAPV